MIYIKIDKDEVQWLREPAEGYREASNEEEQLIEWCRPYKVQDNRVVLDVENKIYVNQEIQRIQKAMAEIEHSFLQHQILGISLQSDILRDQYLELYGQLCKLQGEPPVERNEIL